MKTTRIARLLVAGLLWAAFPLGVAGEDPAPLPPFPAVRHAVETTFRTHPGRQPLDLIARSEVESALSAVQELGWKIQDEQQILAAALPDNHILVTTFRTPAGQRFMRRIAGRELMYDRLDRVSEVSGGTQLIRDIVKLPDGERYAKPMSGGGVPDLLDLLPKDASARTRRIRDYHQPTGHIYTVKDLLSRLDESHRQAVEALAKSTAAGSGN